MRMGCLALNDFVFYATVTLYHKLVDLFRCIGLCVNGHFLDVHLTSRLGFIFYFRKTLSQLLTITVLRITKTVLQLELYFCLFFFKIPHSTFSQAVHCLTHRQYSAN